MVESLRHPVGGGKIGFSSRVKLIQSVYRDTQLLDKKKFGILTWSIAGPDFESEDEGEEFDDWEDDYDYPEEEQLSGAGYRVSAALEEANKMFLRTSRAREAALDGGFQMHYEKTPFDQLAFIEELFSLMVVNRLTEELGCDEIIDRE